MFNLRLFPGPSLMYRAYPMKESAEVRDHAHTFLFETVEVDPAVTLGDIFELMRLSPLLKQVFRRDFAEELCAEADKGAIPPPPTEDPVERIEYINVFQQWFLDSGRNQFQPMHTLRIEGLGPMLEADAPDYARKAGDRIQWGLSCSDLRSMLHLPIRVATEALVIENDLFSKAYCSRLRPVNIEGFSLGQVIHALLWELSFYGGPQQTKEFNESTTEQVAEIDAGRASTTSVDDLFVEMDRPGCDEMFESLGDHRSSAISRAIRDIEDNENAAAALTTALGAGLVVKLAYRELTGYAFRKTFSEVRSELFAANRLAAKAAATASAVMPTAPPA